MPSTKSYNSTGRTTGGNWNNRTHSSTRSNPSTSRPSASSRTYSPTQFKSVNKNIQQWIGSFRNIRTQFNGAGRVSAFSPTGVNKWIKFVNSGAFIYKFTNVDFCNKFSNSFSSPTTSPTDACRNLKRKFGSGIKAVTRGKGGCWLIAASPTVSGSPFSTYKW